MIPKSEFENILAGFANLAPVLVLGDSGIDKYTYGEVKRISPEAPVPILEVTKEWLKLGLAANVADNLKSLEVAVTLCGVIGDDLHGNEMEHLLESANLKTWGLVRTNEYTTIFKERVVTAIQQICRIDYERKESLSDGIQKRVLDRTDEYITSHSGLIIEDYAKGLFNEKICQHVIRGFKEAGKVVAVDPSRSTPPLWYKGAYLLKPNKMEAEMMVTALGYPKEKNVEVIAKILVEKLALTQIIITLGAGGMLILDTQVSDEPKNIPTVASEVFDVSGAGDTAISAITSALLAGANLEQAAWIGNCAAGVVVGKKGTALVDQKELLSFYDKLLTKI